MSKTLINRAKTKEVSNIEGKLEHLKTVLQMNAYPKKFIHNATKTPRSVREKTEYQSSFSIPYTGSASHKLERILKDAVPFLVKTNCYDENPSCGSKALR